MNCLKWNWISWAAVALAAATNGIAPGNAQGVATNVQRVEITEGVVEPVRIAVPDFLVDSSVSRERATNVVRVAIADLESTGIFRHVPPAAYIENIEDFSARPNFADWRAIRVQWLVTGEILEPADGRITVRFRLWDVFARRQATGLQFFGSPSAWRRIAHRVADAIYIEITGEGAYFDTRIAFVEETGPKNLRQKRLALMDQDGANIRYLTGTGRLSMTPRFSPSRQELAYISFADDRAQVYLADIDSGENEFLGVFSGMSFAPRFSPDGRRVVMSMEENGNTDIYIMNLATRQRTRLTKHPAIDTAPSFSPDGAKIAFESDRSNGQQIYVMGDDGSGVDRVTFGDGQYATPVWSPRGDLIAFTKQLGGNFHIGLMTPEGKHERLLTESYHDEGPTWAPNGRVIMFFREYPGANRQPQLFSVDVSGRNLRLIATPQGASDPAWSPLLD